jgi:hypothetical protein
MLSHADERALRPPYIHALACMPSISAAILDSASSLLLNGVPIADYLFLATTVRHRERSSRPASSSAVWFIQAPPRFANLAPGVSAVQRLGDRLSTATVDQYSPAIDVACASLDAIRQACDQALVPVMRCGVEGLGTWARFFAAAVSTNAGAAPFLIRGTQQSFTGLNDSPKLGAASTERGEPV